MNTVIDPLVSENIRQEGIAIRDIQANYQMVCVCGGFGFPHGAGSPARILTVAHALQSAGVDFKLLHCGPSPNRKNVDSSGVYQSVPFQYTTSVNRPDNVVLRAFVYAWGIIRLILELVRLRRENKRTVIWVYLMTGPMAFIVTRLCHWFGFSVIQEMCEWWPAVPTCSAFTQWLHRGSLFTSATGVLAISELIESRVRDIAKRVKPNLQILRLPAIVDAERFAMPKNVSPESEMEPAFVWCGESAWKDDVLFLISAIAEAHKQGTFCKLRVVGSVSGEIKELYEAKARSLGLADGTIEVMGFVDAVTLERTYQSALALLLPLRDDDRSKTRMPNKLGEYLASGRPVITCAIGDLKEFLRDGYNAVLAQPDNAADFARKMIEVIKRPDASRQIGEAGRVTSLQYLDYRAHGENLARFVSACYETNQPHRIFSGLKGTLYLRLRNLACAALALCLIASGRVRSAKRRAQNAPMITPVYFHNPNRKLFRKCILWLASNGYRFLSLEELSAILRGAQPFPAKAAWISLDDGNAEWTTEILPIAQELNVPVTMYVPSGIIKGSRLYPWLHDESYPRPGGQLAHHLPSTPGSEESMGLSDLLKMSEQPQVTIGSHTETHSVLTSCTDDGLKNEIGTSKTDLEAWTGTSIRTFAFPGGHTDARADRYLIEFGYDLATTTEPDFIRPGTNMLRVPRFNVPDAATFPEAICIMAGVWRQALDPIKKVLS